MEFLGGKVGSGGGDWAVKCKLFPSHCDSHNLRLFILGTDIADNVYLVDLVTLRYSVTVNFKKW